MARNTRYTRGRRRTTSPVSQTYSPRHQTLKPHVNNSKENKPHFYQAPNEDDKVCRFFKKHGVTVSLVIYLLLTKDTTSQGLTVVILSHLLEHYLPTKR